MLEQVADVLIELSRYPWQKSGSLLWIVIIYLNPELGVITSCRWDYMGPIKHQRNAGRKLQRNASALLPMAKYLPNCLEKFCVFRSC